MSLYTKAVTKSDDDHRNVKRMGNLGGLFHFKPCMDSRHGGRIVASLEGEGDLVQGEAPVSGMCFTMTSNTL